MAACSEAKELNEMRERAETMAKLVSTLVRFPFRYFSFIINSYRLFFKIFLYFRAVKIDRLAKCCEPREQVCIDCLTKIYEFEQEMAVSFREVTKYRFIGWGFQKIVDKIDDRSEVLVLSIDKSAVNSINKLIDKIEKGGMSNLDWQEQIDAL
jgi:hypothetical protein